MTSISRTCIVVIQIGLLMSAGVSAQQPREPHIKSHQIFIQQLKQPLTRRDERGEERQYREIYVVELKGYFGEARAIPIEVYIGDYKIPEYGGTKDGIYFKIYDRALLDRLEGQAFALGIENQKMEILKLRFTPSAQRPFKALK